MNMRPTFATSDLRHAAFLLARGFQFLGPDTGNGRVKFSFACSQEEASTYFTPEDTVSCRHLFAAWHSLRTLIDDVRNGASSPNKNRNDSHARASR